MTSSNIESALYTVTNECRNNQFIYYYFIYYDIISLMDVCDFVLKVINKFNFPVCEHFWMNNRKYSYHTFKYWQMTHDMSLTQSIVQFNSSRVLSRLWYISRHLYCRQTKITHRNLIGFIKKLITILSALSMFYHSFSIWTCRTLHQSSSIPSTR